MMSCWRTQPRQRPTFAELKPQLEQIRQAYRSKNTPVTVSDPPSRNWLFADISRPEAEVILQEWGNSPGLFLIRESGPIWVMSRIGRSDENSELIVHRKITFTNGKYSMQSTRTTPKDFDSLVRSCALPASFVLSMQSVAVGSVASALASALRHERFFSKRIDGMHID